MKDFIKLSLDSVRKKLNPAKRQSCFEILGYDFILDNEFNTWLIEVNTNPCLEESSRLLRMYLPRMLNDAFKLTVDRLFKIKPSREQAFPVAGFPDG